MEPVDIDKAFDSIVFAEQTELDQGYKEGHEAGCTEARAVGRGLGFQRAAQLASEVGFYGGFAQQALAQLAAADGASDAASQQLRRARPLLLGLTRLIERLPRHNSRDSDVSALLDTVRAKFRQVCAVLKVNPTAGEQKEISF
ncbi:protein LTO1 homolog [Pollicipes pollicipes]|uniref:protein LTO1 homolog n=1 Tax=Pollicipes pollicipes TaxID=41117 RepID=UPI00188571EE|nr:protein LTO1 homolog [Pollicipes pollicipes]